MAWCDCRGLPGGPTLSLQAEKVKEPVKPLTPAKRSDDSALSAVSCSTPGVYWCNTTGERLLVCSPQHEWVLASVCGTTSAGVGW